MNENSQEKCMLYHKTKPWIPNFDKVMIAALPGGELPDEWIKKETQMCEEGPNKELAKCWYDPSEEFWKLHCQVSHPSKDGTGKPGCDAKIHAAFLTPTGENAEMYYANKMKDGRIIVQTAKDFEEECDWFMKEGFGTYGGNNATYDQFIFYLLLWLALVYLFYLIMRK